MGWMKAIFTDVQELNEKVLDLYSEEQIVAPNDAVDPLIDYLYEAGWKSPTEMLALKQNVTSKLRLVYGSNVGAADAARTELMMELAVAFDIPFTDIVAPEQAAAEVPA